MAEGAQVAIGTRKVAGHRTGVVRRIASALFGRLARAVLSLPFSDTQCGMKVFEGSSGRSLFAAQRLHGFAFDAELLWLAERWRLRVVEVPLIVIPPASSTVRVLRDGSHMLWELLRVRWFALRGKYGPPPA
jgi:dolichyl-phosphate beta-glucosyltransferase